MKALFGVASLLIVLAIVGLLTVRQMHAAGRVPGSLGSGAVGPAGGATPADTTVPLPQRARALEQRVASDVAAAMRQGAASRADDDSGR